MALVFGMTVIGCKGEPPEPSEISSGAKTVWERQQQTEMEE